MTQYGNLYNSRPISASDQRLLDLTAVQNQNPTQGGSAFVGSDGSMTGFGMGSLALGGVQAGLGLYNAYLGSRQYSLAKKQFNFEKALARVNLANQAKTINTEYDTSARGAAAMQGSGGSWGAQDPALVQAYLDRAAKQHVSGTI